MKIKYILFIFLIVLIVSGISFYDGNNNRTTELIPHKYNMEYKGINLVGPIKELNEKTFIELTNNNINSISLIPYAFVDMDQATVSYNHQKQWWGERTEGIIASIHKSHENKMTVMLKPHLWVSHGFYTGDLNFSSEMEWLNWEADYEKYILSFALLAQKEKVALFCFGTELGNPIAKRPKYWTALIKKIRKVYDGKLTYAANWDDFDEVPFWNDLDYIGIDAYFPLSNVETPSVAILNQNWKKHILKMETIHQKFNKKIIFTEFGYRNSNNAAEQPWTETNDVANNKAQANGYEALFQSFSEQKWFAGGYAWKWYADEYHKKKNIDYTPQEKPALTILKKWYK
ncbi:glycoside hydrolase family 113 [Flavobacterium aquidurense]|uniref:glycoside hydrolase family 113 n=1 Tax=Flavobacterium aquidurense TaxID=362413 RepID=UPI00375636E3